MIQVKRTHGQRATDLAEMIKLQCVFEDKRIVLAALQSVTAQVIFVAAPDHKQMEAADLAAHQVKKSLINLRSKVQS